MINTWLHLFFSDKRTQIALLLIVLDLGFGVLSGVVKGNFRLSFIADFMRNDVLGKVFPFFLVYGGYLFAKNKDIVIPGFDFDIIMNGVWAIVLAALVGSLLNSLKDLNLVVAKDLPEQIAGPDPVTPALPVKPATP